jgi:hypothetical protein
LDAIAELMCPQPVEAPRLGPAVEVVFDDGRRLSIAEYLRQYSRNLSDSFRTRLALASSPHLLEGSVLGEWIEEPLGPRLGWGQRVRVGQLPAETRIILEAALVLQSFGRVSPDFYRKLGNDLRVVRESLGVRPGSPGSAANDDPDLEAYRRVEDELAVLEDLVRKTERIIQSAGYCWNWDAGVVEIPPGLAGGRPRQLLRDLVKTLLLALGADENTVEVRETIATELAPFFSAELLDTTKHSPLYNAVDNALRGK